MLALIQREVVDRRGWIDEEEFLNMIALAQAAPGIIAVNSAIFIGWRIGGWKGVVGAVLGAVLPSFVIILLVMALLKRALKNPWVQAVLRGVKPCIVGIILATGLFFLFRNCFGSVEAPAFNIMALLLTAVLALVYFGSRKVLKKGLSPIGFIGLAALAGILVYGWK